MVASLGSVISVFSILVFGYILYTMSYPYTGEKVHMVSDVNNLLRCDAPFENQFSFQDTATPIAEGIVDLHSDVMFFLAIILPAVIVTLYLTISYYNVKSTVVSAKANVTHHVMLEIV
jgi:heme/copper-type cytochrome/quinol oxidase subunit 2